MYDIMQFTEEQNISGLLLPINFEKAFDSLSWSFVNKILKLYNFGPLLKKWVAVIHKNSCSAVTQCGILSF